MIVGKRLIFAAGVTRAILVFGPIEKGHVVEQVMGWGISGGDLRLDCKIIGSTNLQLVETGLIAGVTSGPIVQSVIPPGSFWWAPLWYRPEVFGCSLHCTFDRTGAAAIEASCFCAVRPWS